MNLLEKARSLQIPVEDTSSISHYIKIAKSYSDSENIWKAVIVLSLLYEKTNDEILILNLSNEIFNKEGNYVFKIHTEKGIRNSIWGVREWKYWYPGLIEACIKFPCGWIPKMLFFWYDICSEEARTIQQESSFIERLKEFYLDDVDMQKDYYFLLLEEVLWVDRRKEATYEKILVAVMRKVILYEDARDWLMAFWIYKMYTGDKKAVEVSAKYIAVLGLDIEQEYKRFTTDPIWPWLKGPTLKERYVAASSKLAGLLTGEAVSGTPMDFIPIITFAQQRNDVETASLYLWYACRNHDMPALFERMKELCGGFPVSDEFQRLPKASRIDWFESRIAKLTRAKNKKEPLTPKELGLLREVYSVNPFNPRIVETLFKAGLIGGNKDFRQMYEFSISKITSKYTLNSLLVGCVIYRKNRHAAKCLLKRMYDLGYGSVLLNVANTIIAKFRKNDLLLVESVGQILKVYEQYMLRGEPNMLSYQSIKNWYKKFNRSAESVFSTEELSFMQKSNDVRKLLKVGNLNTLVSLVKQSETSISDIELILQYVLKHGACGHVFDVYQALVRRDKNRAIVYNSEVEPDILLYNRNRRDNEKRGLVSGIWGIAVHLENPVNRTASSLK